MGKMKSRKWGAFLWVMLLESFGAFTGIIMFIKGGGGTATGFVIACFSAMAGTLAFYFTANVIQKKIIGPPKGDGP